MPSAFISLITVRGFLEELNTFEENVKKKIKIIITLDKNNFIVYYYPNHYLFQYYKHQYTLMPRFCQELFENFAKILPRMKK